MWLMNSVFDFLLNLYFIGFLLMGILMMMFSEFGGFLFIGIRLIFMERVYSEV